MITAKRIWYGAVLLLVGALLASSAAYLLVDDETLVDWIAARAGAAAGVRIDYAPAVEVSRRLSPALSVSNLTVADPDTGYRVHTGSLELRVSLPWLLCWAGWIFSASGWGIRASS